MAITSVAVARRPLDWSACARVLASASSSAFRASAADRRARPLRGAHWEDDPAFDLDLHLHPVALPAPGDRASCRRSSAT